MRRLHGTLVRWNETRGFGFVLPAQGSADVFVHVSAFPPAGPPPRVGEFVSYEIEAAPDGRRRAVRVWRAGGPPGQRAAQFDTLAAPRARRHSGANRVLVRIAFAAGIGALLLLATGQLRNLDLGDWSLHPHAVEARRAASVAPAAALAADDRATFNCDGRTRCSQMTSCAEATFFLKHCPNVQMDGDHDGIPCEQQWCTR